MKRISLILAISLTVSNLEAASKSTLKEKRIAQIAFSVAVVTIILLRATEYFKLVDLN